MVYFNISFNDNIKGSDKRDIKSMRNKAKALKTVLETLFDIDDIDIDEDRDFLDNEYVTVRFNVEDKLIKKVFKYCKISECYYVNMWYDPKRG